MSNSNDEPFNMGDMMIVAGAALAHLKQFIDAAAPVVKRCAEVTAKAGEDLHSIAQSLENLEVHLGQMNDRDYHRDL